MIKTANFLKVSLIYNDLGGRRECNYSDDEDILRYTWYSLTFYKKNTIHTYQKENRKRVERNNITLSSNIYIFRLFIFTII